ncbi:MAG: RHS repeat-associated core domain-containing protein [Anaerolineae bacterium]
MGNLASATDTDSSLTFTYDFVGRLIAADTGATVAQPATSTTYTYDKNGNRLTMTDPQGGITNYVNDALNRLTSLTSPQGTSTFTYDALSRRTGLTLPNGATSTYTYDVASQLTELLNTIGATTISRFAYTYDAVGNRITRTTTNGIATYDYDALNRLTQAIQPDPIDPLQQLTETFAYDPVGNRTSSHLATGQVHDAANRLLEDSSFTYTYDANGNLGEQVSKATGERTVYTYNVENQLIRVEKFTVAGGLSPVLTADYRYDPLGRRIEKAVTQAGTTTVTRYVYDNEDILLEFDGSNVVQARYTHGPGIDEPLIMLRGGQSFFYHADGLGSVWDLTDTAGTSVRSYTYDSFGQLVAQTGTLANPYTFTAREFDAETGLYLYRNRYYDPQVGRFLTEDPQAAEGVVNFYAYVGNNPIRFRDPFGLQPFAEPIRDFKPNPTATEIALALTAPLVVAVAAEPTLVGATITAVNVAIANAIVRVFGSRGLELLIQFGIVSTKFLEQQGPTIVAPPLDIERTLDRIERSLRETADELGILPACFLGA